MASATHDLSPPAAAANERTFEPQPYSNPYLAGIGLGLVLLAAFVFMGRGLGASGAFNSTLAWITSHAGSWIFMLCFFGGAYGAAWFVRRQWR